MRGCLCTFLPAIPAAFVLAHRFCFSLYLVCYCLCIVCLCIVCLLFWGMRSQVFRVQSAVRGHGARGPGTRTTPTCRPRTGHGARPRRGRGRGGRRRGGRRTPGHVWTCAVGTRQRVTFLMAKKWLSEYTVSEPKQQRINRTAPYTYTGYRNKDERDSLSKESRTILIRQCVP